MCKYIGSQLFRSIVTISFGILSASNYIQASDELPPHGSVQKIPKIFHNIWFNFGKGEDVLPQYANNIRELQALHPDWEFRLWKKKDILELIEQVRPDFLQTFLSYDVPIKQHDAARPIILKAFGGCVY